MDWYFDFISPYSYLQFERMPAWPAGVTLVPKPILFAGLLNHWGQKGPAEIPPKRVWTYRSCLWWAQQNNIPFQVPAAHPFNPLPYLRLAMAAGNSAYAVRTIFESLWTTGANPVDSGAVVSVAVSLGVPLERIADERVKEGLRAATELAAAKGVFGVPTLAIDEQLFWGNDSFDFATAYLLDPSILETEEMRRIDSLPAAAGRI